MNKRIGVYICHCGGNISDYVDVAEAQRLMQDEDGVLISKHVMFACSDATQTEMVNDIKENQLDAIVVASCSPKLHTHTFRGVADRAGLNKYNYIQVNIREQCSWPHSDKPLDATHKAIGLIRAGIKKAALSEALESVEIEAYDAMMVVGAGVSGLKAALELAKNGHQVYLLEKEKKVGGKLVENGSLFMTGEHGNQLVERLLEEIKNNTKITLFTESEVEKVNGSIGNFNIDVNVGMGCVKTEKMTLAVGSVLVATGYDYYQPKENEFAFGMSPRVITLPELKKRMEKNNGVIIHNNKPVKSLAFVYCVGNRQRKGENKYCSRICCTTAIHTGLLLKEKNKDLKIIHLYRDIRTYGKQELLYEQSSKQGDVYMKFDEKEPPQVDVKGDSLLVKVKDYLTQKKEIEFSPDLLVLVTGAVARSDSSDIAAKFKIPVGADRFFNEIHPKLKPVETVINGVLIGGACQSPKNVSESVQSSLSAVSKMLSLIKNNRIRLEPIIARVNEDACLWCGKCAEVCEFDALKEITCNGKQITEVNPATCKGCGICVPVCPSEALELKMFSDKEIEAMIDGFVSQVELSGHSEEPKQLQTAKKPLNLKRYPEIWSRIANCITDEHKTIPEIAKIIGEDIGLVTWHLMTMNKYNYVQSDGMDKKDQYFYYKLKN
ncbi:MAG TPA: FAD-dependent oxidoreductase [Bacteroidales bacterium]|jgi:heterodisulfide reductase subunit A|nr:CoB--CoM heterodisulfide reductase iron-sulfur subunit A family protein [Bacteroidales bacterium]HPB25224.1 FAD-dependent oxidoreductase [Bacteroidales bacterium]HPI29948.1 FAD-dependent oxidoreductase [Bacteroidales bacterium]HQN16031.1 FAD-dependent oxidoreductase [Bacteroidales bacterium]HQP15649.1 FAD-dependent oxidoreductase [Bacteroidales bacterium]